MTFSTLGRLIRLVVLIHFSSLSVLIFCSDSKLKCSFALAFAFYSVRSVPAAKPDTCLFCIRYLTTDFMHASLSTLG